MLLYCTGCPHIPSHCPHDDDDDNHAHVTCAPSCATSVSCRPHSDIPNNTRTAVQAPVGATQAARPDVGAFRAVGGSIPNRQARCVAQCSTGTLAEVWELCGNSPVLGKLGVQCLCHVIIECKARKEIVVRQCAQKNSLTDWESLPR